jgi:aspartyl protease family protein
MPGRDCLPALTRVAVALAAAVCAAAAVAAQVGVVGLFPGKAVVSIDGGSPRVLRIGQRTSDGIRLLSVEGDDAILEIDGKRSRISIGQQVYSGASGGGSGQQRVTLTANSNGQFVTVGSVNGASMRFVVDTGATLVSLGASDARRAGIEIGTGQPMVSVTANGPIRVWRVHLHSLRIGEVVLNDVDAAVEDVDMPFALLGMSFLNRMDMRRQGDTMTLLRRY